MGGQRADGICNKRLLTTRTAKFVMWLQSQMTVSSTIPRSEQPAVDHSPMKKDGTKNYCKYGKILQV